MYWVGKRYETAEAEASKKERAYRAKDEAGKAAERERYREELRKQHDEKHKAALQKQNATQKGLVDFLQRQTYVMEVQPSRTSSRLKYRARASAWFEPAPRPAPSVVFPADGSYSNHFLAVPDRIDRVPTHSGGRCRECPAIEAATEDECCKHLAASRLQAIARGRAARKQKTR